VDNHKREFSYYLFAITPFFLLLLWEWRFINLFRFLPSYGDVLEVVWGISWYSRSLFSSDISPLFTSLIFHPLGWHTATLAHTPFFFALGIPFYLIGGGAFAYNFLAITSLIVAYLGSIKCLEVYVPRNVAILGAIVYTFAGVRSARMGGGHLHILWASSLFPWLGWALMKFSLSKKSKISRKYLIVSGLIWGLMINFSLYTIFFGGVILLVTGKRLLSIETIKSFLIIACIALLVGSISIVPYVFGELSDQPSSFGMTHVVHWGASLNSLSSPFVFHPFNDVKVLARSIYTGPLDESGVANIGLITLWLAMLGIICIFREKRKRGYGIIIVSLVGLVLALGPFLKWNGEVLELPIFRHFNLMIWRIGKSLKPDLFQSGTPSVHYDSGIPLPGFILTTFVPFWESARTVSRYALVGYFGLVALATYGIWRLPYRFLRYLFMVVWLLEGLPPRTGQVPLPSVTHPAYRWLEEQGLSRDEGIVDFGSPTLNNSGETLYATLFHDTPTASGVGSFWPSHTFSLWEYFLRDDALLDEEAAPLLNIYDIRYIFLHLKGTEERPMWDMIAQNPDFQRVGCFEPESGISPWSYPICVAEVQETPNPPINVLLHDGWSVREPWGVWAEGTASKTEWFAEQRSDYRLIIEAFPNCVLDKSQSILIEVNGHELQGFRWQDCETIRKQFMIPRDYIRVGRNNLELFYGYATVPTDPETGASIDSRTLSVGFSVLKITNP
jgi:hypothetical protein